MSDHPVFLIVRGKIRQADAALAHMTAVHTQQCGVRDAHPEMYSIDVHAESLVTNVQGIYTQFESILKRLADTIDGFSPSGDSWHRDLLLQAASGDGDRPKMIGPATLDAMSELMAFRHATRNNYAIKLRHPDVFRNMALLQAIAPTFISDIKVFMAEFGRSTPPAPVDRG